jgi:hypothetical protein
VLQGRNAGTVPPSFAETELFFWSASGKTVPARCVDRLRICTYICTLYLQVGSTRHAQAAEGVHGSSVCLEPSTTRCSASTRDSTIYSIQHVFYRQTFGGGLRWSPSREGREDLLPDAKKGPLLMSLLGNSLI